MSEDSEHRRSVDQLFRPDSSWQELPPQAALAGRIDSLIANLITWAIIVAVIWFFFGRHGWPQVAAIVAAVGWTLWRVIRRGRWIRSFRYSERERDLLLSRGLWYRELTAVPYGRMLSVEVTANPVARLWKLAEVQLVTASHQSNATIPGLTSADAAALRDRLIARGEDQALPL